VAARFRCHAEHHREEGPVRPVQLRATRLLPPQGREMVAQAHDRIITGERRERNANQFPRLFGGAVQVKALQGPALRGVLTAAAGAAITATALTACSASHANASRTVTLAHDLTIRLPQGAKATAKPAPAATASMSRYRTLLKILAPAVQVTVTNPAIVSFHVNAPAGAMPFVASFTGGRWKAIPSTYRAGILSARIPGDPVLVPLDWLSSALEAMVSEALQGVFGLASSATDPACALNGTLPVTDSNPRHHTVGYCAEPAAALPSGNVIARVTNERSYPIDLSYPASVGSRCGEYGKCLRFPANNDPWTTLGALLSPGNRKVLLLGSAQADAITATPAGQTATFSTTIDYPAMFFGFLESGVKLTVAIVTRGISKVKAAQVTSAAIHVLDVSACAKDGWRGPKGLVKLASSAFTCVGAFLPDILGKLGLRTLNLIVDAFQTATDFVAAGVAGMSGVLDSMTGASSHSLTIHGPALDTVVPTAADTFMAEGQDPNAAAPLHAPACHFGCSLSGDATAILDNMTWSMWNATEALGTGTEHLEDCIPNCASGGQYKVPVVVTFSKPVKDCAAQYGTGSTALGGTRWFWSRASFTYPEGLPKAFQGADALQNPWVFTPLIAAAKQSCS
jgi:hypothetical protein